MIKQEALGESELFLDFQERLSRVAPIERAVLILGERGVGKELAASRLHFLSKRWQGPFVTLNCAALAPGLIESELFGHRRGAFTGAVENKVGRFELADGGTLFLDEIGAIPIETQEKILRVVEYGTFERVGSPKPVEVNVRIVGATNEDLLSMAEAGSFKSDLLDRLSFEVLFVPPLRLRDGDILLLAEHFARRMAFELGRDEVFFTQGAIDQLKAYSWPGNIRELKNVVERAVYRSEGKAIAEIDCDPFAPPWRAMKNVERQQSFEETLPVLPCSLSQELCQMEIALLKKSLGISQYNQRQAAELLGLTYDQLRNRLKKYKNELGEYAA